jgi:hypothetical protein
MLAASAIQAADFVIGVAILRACRHSSDYLGIELLYGW